MKKIIAILFVLAATATAAPEGQRSSKENQETISVGEALKKLQDGNARFMAGKPLHPHEARAWRNGLESGQHPFAVVLGCSDSRVAPELIFDQGFGDLFTVRVAGNVVDIDVTASIEYAVDHLGTHLILVMGHTNCGAVTAMLDLLDNPSDESAEIVSLLYRIEPAAVGISKDMPRKKRINQVIQRNVSLAVRRLSRVPDLRKRLKTGEIKIIGAVFDMHTGKLEVLE